MNFLRLEFKNNQFIKAMGDLEDFLEWLGDEKPGSLNYPELKTMPVFERLGLDYTLAKDKRKNQATFFVMKDTPFLKRFLRLSGKRTYSKRAAVVSALLALWELETLRKVNAVKDAFGVERVFPLAHDLRRKEDNHLPSHFF